MMMVPLQFKAKNKLQYVLKFFICVLKKTKLRSKEMRILNCHAFVKILNLLHPPVFHNVERKYFFLAV